MKLNLPNDKFKFENLESETIGRILQTQKPRYDYLITDGANGTNNIIFQDENDFHSFKQTLKFYKHL